MRRHVDDHIDFAETHPTLIAEWRALSVTHDGKYRTDADRANAIRCVSAARSHFSRRHPNATAEEASEAYSNYDWLVRGQFVEGYRPSWAATFRFVTGGLRQYYPSPWFMRRLSFLPATFAVCAVCMTLLCLMGVVIGKAVAGNALGSFAFAGAAFVFLRASKAIDRAQRTG
jgi:hypothetical protein